mmetsp:Transcript_7261/g.13544  ORF Transcript_7261/g.13544 Transcript_7261/m.13544 type:complete len:464 (+) Transcript_7261:3-1394(+)
MEGGGCVGAAFRCRAAASGRPRAAKRHREPLEEIDFSNIFGNLSLSAKGAGGKKSRVMTAPANWAPRRKKRRSRHSSQADRTLLGRLRHRGVKRKASPFRTAETGLGEISSSSFDHGGKSNEAVSEAVSMSSPAGFGLAHRRLPLTHPSIRDVLKHTIVRFLAQTDVCALVRTSRVFAGLGLSPRRKTHAASSFSACFGSNFGGRERRTSEMVMAKLARLKDNGQLEHTGSGDFRTDTDNGHSSSAAQVTMNSGQSPSLVQSRGVGSGGETMVGVEEVSAEAAFGAVSRGAGKGMEAKRSHALQPQLGPVHTQIHTGTGSRTGSFSGQNDILAAPKPQLQPQEAPVQVVLDCDRSPGPARAAVYIGADIDIDIDVDFGATAGTVCPSSSPRSTSSCAGSDCARERSRKRLNIEIDELNDRFISTQSNNSISSRDRLLVSDRTNIELMAGLFAFSPTMFLKQQP